MSGGFFSNNWRAFVGFAYGPVITLFYPLSWLLERYHKRLKDQMLVEGDHSTQKPFLETSKIPRRGFVPSRLIMAAFIFGMLMISIGTFLVLLEAIVRGFGLQDAEFTGPTADLVLILLLGAFYAVFVAVAELTRGYILEGRFFAKYDQLMTHVRALKSSAEVLAYAPTLKLCSKRHIRGPYDLYRLIASWRAPEDHSAYYRSERLLELLTLLEQRYPFVCKDEEFRQRYWDFGRALYRVLSHRNPNLVKTSLFSGRPAYVANEAGSRFNGERQTLVSHALSVGEDDAERMLN